MSQVPLNDLKRHNGPLAEALHAACARVIQSGWYILGQEVAAFETEFAAWCGVSACVSVANGTDALELALRTLGIGPGDRVATVANAGMYAAAAIMAVGARPVFVDIDPIRLTMDPESLEARITGVKAVIATHLYGRLADMAAILAAASGVPVIEDCAQAHGAARQGRKAGSFGTLGTFSFFPTKNLGALGDGGAVVTSDPVLAERLGSLRQYGWSDKYRAQRAGGRNSRLDEMQAAVLRLKLPLVDGWNAKRRAICARYAAALPEGAMPRPDEADAAHLAVAQMDGRDAVREKLAGLGIRSDIHYPVADYRQPALARLGPVVALPATEAALSRILTLPCFPEMTDAEVARVLEALGDAV